MLIDFNSIAKACWENKYDTNEPPRFEEVDELTLQEMGELISYIEDIKSYNNYMEFKQKIVESLKTILVIAHIKQINLNDFFKISLNLPEV